MGLVDSKDIGSNQEGLDGFTNLGSSVDNGDYYTFNGTSQGLYKGSDWGDETTIDIKVKFRVHSVAGGDDQIFWKSGGSGNGIAVGIDDTGSLGVFGRNSSSRTEITLASGTYSENVWYYLFATTGQIALQEVDNLANYTIQTGSFTPGNGTDNESIGFSRTSCPVAGGAATNQSYLDGDIDYVELWSAGTLEFTPPMYFHGQVTELGTAISGADIHVYNQDSGAYITSTTSSGDGHFLVWTTWSGAHFLVCLDNEDTVYNALVYRDLVPITVSSG
jgi:hypothetical protein